MDNCEKGHHKLLHSQALVVELLPENKGVHCGRVQTEMSNFSKAALKAVPVPFLTVYGTVLLDSGSETTLIRTGFANQLGLRGPRQSLNADAVGGVHTTIKSQRVSLPFAPSVTTERVSQWTMNNICTPVQPTDSCN